MSVSAPEVAPRDKFSEELSFFVGAVPIEGDRGRFFRDLANGSEAMRLKEIGDKLREIRLKKNLSLREAAEKVGLSHTYLNALEKGHDPRTGRAMNPSARTLVRIAEGYGIPLEELLRMASPEGAEESDDLEAVARSLQTLEPEDREVILYLIKRLHGG